MFICWLVEKECGVKCVKGFERKEKFLMIGLFWVYEIRCNGKLGVGF